MTEITLRILDGSDRGRIFEALHPPVTIGREEGNTIQLNDERISRFHLKIQEDHSKLVLTDLESTNGTRVNGEDVQLRILRFGDMISVGRSVLLFGSRDEIDQRMASQRANGDEEGTAYPEMDQLPERAASLEFDVNWSAHDDMRSTMNQMVPPELPDSLSPAQAAQLSEILEYLHIRIRELLASVRSDVKGEQVQLDLVQWQNLLDLQSRLSEYLRAIGDPPS